MVEIPAATTAEIPAAVTTMVAARRLLLAEAQACRRINSPAFSTPSERGTGTPRPWHFLTEGDESRLNEKALLHRAAGLFASYTLYYNLASGRRPPFKGVRGISCRSAGDALFAFFQ